MTEEKWLTCAVVNQSLKREAAIKALLWAEKESLIRPAV